MKIESVLKTCDALFMKLALVLGFFVGLQACGEAGPPASTRTDTGGTGDAAGATVSTGGMAGMASSLGGSALPGTGGQPGAGGTGSLGGTGGTGALGGAVGTGGVVGTGGAATGGHPGTGGMAAPSACSYPGASFTKDGMYRGITTGGTCGPCSTDKECTTAYGADNQCMGGSCTLVGPWGPMPRQTCNSINASYAIGQAATTSAVSANSSDSSCVDQAKSFVGNRPSIYLCKGIPMNYSGTVLSVTPNDQTGWSDADGNCSVTVVTQIPGSNGCQFEAIFSLSAQAPPKGTGPFSPPTCN